MRPDGMYDRTPCTSNIVISLFIEPRITVSFLYTPTMRSIKLWNVTDATQMAQSAMKRGPDGIRMSTSRYEEV